MDFTSCFESNDTTSKSVLGRIYLSVKVDDVLLRFISDIIILLNYKRMIIGSIKFAIKKPPAINDIVAISEGSCKLLKPIIA